jgi:hypothetical protein
VIASSRHPQRMHARICTRGCYVFCFRVQCTELLCSQSQLAPPTVMAELASLLGHARHASLHQTLLAMKRPTALLACCNIAGPADHGRGYRARWRKIVASVQLSASQRVRSQDALVISSETTSSKSNLRTWSSRLLHLLSL